MNKQETAEAIKVMQAWIDNEPIQIQDVGSKKWRPIGTEYEGVSQPSWAWFSATYRIKPKPREFWIWWNHDGELLCRAMIPNEVMHREAIIVREVLNENL